MKYMYVIPYPRGKLIKQKETNKAIDIALLLGDDSVK